MASRDPVENQPATTPASSFDSEGAAEASPESVTQARRGRAQPLTLDANGYAHVDGRSIRLTLLESKLLRFFLEHPGHLATRGELLKSVWGGEYHGGKRTVDVHVRRLRAKLGESFQLETERGVGYGLRA